MSSTGDWSRVRDLFEQALNLPEDRRRAFIESAAAGDGGLLEELETLLHAHNRTHDFLEAPPRFDTESFDASAILEGPGSMIDRYRLLSVLGEGGFGVVYLAESDRPIRRQVALKVLKPGMDSRQIIARFEAERQALALMDHPHVAKVFDAGATKTGRPYFVMEHVVGVPITEYCDRNQLSTAERLRLFIKVCQAVQHAHQKGMIHRDLKPSNILVSGDGSRGRPKVIDFGVAKAVAQPLTDATLQTERGQFIGTPEYMSPEQTESAGHDIDTRADIYSLGVVLYQLLTGVLPFDSAQMRQGGLDQVFRVIREQEPRTPSTRLSTIADAETIAQRHGRTTVRTLRRQLRHDLDWITLKAMEKDRSRRYESAAALAQDIERFLNQEPVVARPPSTLYRLGKLARRNRVAFGAGGAIAAALVIGTVLATAGFVQARRERDQAESARQDAQEQTAIAQTERDAADEARADAQQQAATAHATVSFLQQILASADPNNLGKDIKVVEALNAAAERLDTAFPDQPLVEAAVRETVAKTYLELGDAPRADRHYALAFERAVEAHGWEHDLPLHLMGQRLFAWRAVGGIEAAEPIYDRIIEARTEMFGPEDVRTIDALAQFGFLLSHYDLERAEPIFRDVLDARLRLYGENHPSTLSAIRNLGGTLREKRDLDGALEMYERYAKGTAALHGAESVAALQALNDQAFILQELRRWEEAEATYRKAIVGMDRVRGPDHPETLNIRQNLVTVYYRSGRLDQAILMQREILELRTQALGEQHPLTIKSLHNLSVILRVGGRLDEALECTRRAVALGEKTHGPDTFEVVMARHNLLNTYRDMDRHTEALAEGQYLVAIAPHVFTNEADERHGMFRRSLALTLRDLGRYDEAEQNFRMLLDWQRTQRPQERERVLRGYEELAQCLDMAGRHDAAGAALLEGYRDCLSHEGEGSEPARKLAGLLAAQHDAAGNTDAAERWRGVQEAGATVGTADRSP